MIRVAAFLRFRVARLLSTVRHPLNAEMKTVKTAPDGVLPTPAKASPCSAWAYRAATQRNGYMKPHWGGRAAGTLAATFALLIMTACGGGWGGLTGQPPVITSQPVSQTVTVGQTATFNVTATGTGPLTYQWFDNGTAITGATSSSYTTPAATSTDSGSVFTVTVTNASGTVTSSPATLTVSAGSTTVNPNAPLIITQPANQTVAVGQTATFSVTATGSATLTYQWFKGGVAISGATSSTYTTPATVSGDSGSLFTVTVSNSLGTVTSNPATLTVINPTPIAPSLSCNPLTPPYNSTSTLIPIFSGGTAVIGSAGLGSTDITTSAVSGSSYITPTLTSAKTYTLSVTGSGGAVASTSCTVTPTSVTISPITPANATVAPGERGFNATASGGATDNLTWTASAGTFSGNMWTSPNAAGTYTITATSVDEPSVFVTTTVTVSAPVIVTQPVNQNVCVNSSATLSVIANYAASYQWNFNGAPIPGATSSSYFIASATTANAGNYTVTVTNPAGSVTSNIAQVVVGVSITSNPVSLSILTGQTATFSVAAAGEAPFSYQWYVIAPGGSSGTAIAGATSSTYTTPAETVNQNGSQFYVTVSNACGVTPLTSTDALLAVTGGNSPPTILSQPVSQTVAVGGTATFTVTAAGSPTLTYQWYQIPAGSPAGTVVQISGATSTSYTVPATATNITDDQDGYYVIVTNPYGQAVSVTATLAVGAGIRITKQPVNDFVNAGDPATFSVTATSSLPLSYQWYEAPPGSSTFTAIPGATSATYTQPSTAITDNDSVFYVVVSNGTTASVTSNSAVLFVGSLGTIPDVCDWNLIGNAQVLPGPCSVQLVSATTFQHGEIVWPNLVSTGNIQFSFTITTSGGSNPPADGFAFVLGDPSLGATPTSIGADGLGLGAEGIPGVVLAFDDFYDQPGEGGDPTFVGDPIIGNPPISPYPGYLGLGSTAHALWENPYLSVNTSITPLATPADVPINNPVNPAPNPPSSTVVNNFTISIVQGMITVTMNGTQVFSASATVPPVAYMYFTAATGGSYENAVVSNFSATVSAPSN
jgi:hypothetical protein